MALTLVTNPVGSAASKFFAGFQKCELKFKREDLAITGVESGSGGIKITLGTDLTSYLQAGDVIYLYSEGTDYTYSQVGTISGITSGDITIEGNFIQTGTGGYINYLKNYFVELQCVDKTYNDANLLPFSLQSDGDSAGNVVIDVSIMNELNETYGAIEFMVKYREMSLGIEGSFTQDDKLFIILNTIDTPEAGDILNNLDEPCLYLGYPANLRILNAALSASSTKELKYNELDINKQNVASGTMGSILADQNAFISWPWLAGFNAKKQTEYISFSVENESFYDFKHGDFRFPDFRTNGDNDVDILTDDFSHWTGGIPDGWGFAPGAGASITNDGNKVKISVSKDNMALSQFYQLAELFEYGKNYQVEFDIVGVSVDIHNLAGDVDLFCSVDFGGALGSQFIIKTGDHPADVIKHWVLKDFVNTVGAEALSFQILNEIPSIWAADPYLIIANVIIKQI
jgi:hypothetical protein